MTPLSSTHQPGVIDLLQLDAPRLISQEETKDEQQPLVAVEQT